MWPPIMGAPQNDALGSWATIALIAGPHAALALCTLAVCLCSVLSRNKKEHPVSTVADESTPLLAGDGGEGTRSHHDRDEGSPSASSCAPRFASLLGLGVGLGCAATAVLCVMKDEVCGGCESGSVHFAPRS